MGTLPHNPKHNRGQEDTMIRSRVLKIILVVVGLLFVAGIYPLIELKDEEAQQMMLSLRVTLGVFLLLAARPRPCIAALSPSPPGRALPTPP